MINLDDYEDEARTLLPKMAYDYYRSGSEHQQTLKRNRKAFRSFELWYRVLVDVSEVDLSTTVLGTDVAMPILVAPTAYHRLAHPGGECETAQGVAKAETVMCVSTLATTSLEDVAAASECPKWFQLYVHKDRGLTKTLVERADAAGYKAIVLTVDAPVLGRRLDDERNSFALPEGMSMQNFVEGAMDPLGDIDGSALGAYVAARHDASVTWHDLDWLRSVTSLPIVIKGIVRPDDALRAVDHGIDAIIVSNHGGRQLDYAPASIVALADVAPLVRDRIEVFMDGGIRTGTDVLIALALGARAVLLGRPILWGLAVEGADGVAKVLSLLGAELRQAMQLAGCPNLTSIDQTLVRRAS
ncbi:MAG: alpha-hydroxy acid oxidase [Actinomycetota bacterium]